MDMVGGVGWRGAPETRLDQLERLPKTSSHLLYSANSQSMRCPQDYSISLLSLDSVCKCAQYSCYIHVGFKPKQKQWGGVGWVGWVNNVHVPLQNYVMLPYVTFLHACTSTQCYIDVTFFHACETTSCYVDVTFLHACGTTSCYVDVSFLHACTKTKVAGTQQIDRCWNHLKNFCPSQMKNRTGPTINARIWDRIYQWIYRHNMSKWDMTWRPHARWKKKALETFVVWCRNWPLKKWQNVRRFGTWMSKTHGCVNPCYHV